MATQQLKRDQDFWCTQIQGTRDYQEDDTGFDDSHPGLLLMLLADGMGGYAGGDTASKKAVEVFANSFNPEDNRTTPDRLEFSLSQANNALAQTIEKKPELKGMGCTFVGAVLSHNNSRLHWVSVGDSPLCVFRNGSLIRLNVDHSKRIELDEQVRKGEITAQEAAKSPERNSLTSALTGEPPALIDNNSRGVEFGDILLLASDGLFTLSESEIEQKLSQSINNSAEEIVNKLLGAVKKKKRAGQDNTTVLIVKIPKSLEDDLSLEVKPITDFSQEKVPGSKWKLVIGAILFLIAMGSAFFAGKILSERSAPEDLKKIVEIDAASKNIEKTDTKEFINEKAIPKDTSNKKTNPKESDTKKVNPKKITTEKTKPKETSNKKKNSKEPDAKKVNPKKITTKKADVKKKMTAGVINHPEKTSKNNSDGFWQRLKALFGNN